MVIILLGRCPGMVLLHRLRNLSILFLICFLFASCKPDADFRAFQTTGAAPLEVYFDASLSKAKENAKLTYKWDFDSNGIADAEGLTASHKYSAGIYKATLTVIDENGMSTETSQKIKAGTGTSALAGVLAADAGEGEEESDPNYNSKGSTPFHDFSSMMPCEQVDPFTGNLMLTLTPFSLPQRGGWNLNINLVYNSKIFRDPQFNDIAEDSWVGVGWSLHMGRIIAPGTKSMVVELPDGSSHQCYSTNGDGSNAISPWRTRENWLITHDGEVYTLILDDGTKYIFESLGGVVAGTKVCYPTTKISDTSGNDVIIIYDPKQTMSGRLPFINNIKDTYNREISFNLHNSETGPSYLQSISSGGRTFSITYYNVPEQVGPSRYKLLTTFNAPLDQNWKFNYYVRKPLFELKSFITPTGAKISYTYNTIAFTDINSRPVKPLKFRSVIRKELSGDTVHGTWDYEYYDGNQTRVICKDGSNNIVREEIYNFYGYNDLGYGSFWLTGLISKKALGYVKNGVLYRSQEEYYSWDRHMIVDHVSGSLHYDDKVYTPVLKKREIIRGTNKTYATAYNGYKDNPYGHPTTITETGDKTRMTTVAYWYKADKNIVNGSHISSKTVTVEGKSCNDTFSYWENSGKLHTKTLSGVTSTYSYDEFANLQRITDANDHSVTYGSYKFGKPQTINKTEYVEKYVINNQWGDTDQQYIDGRGNTTSYTYDGLGRLKTITPPVGASAVYTYPLHGAYILESRGGYSMYTMFNSLGHKTGTYEVGASVKTDIDYDILGRKIFESYPYSVTPFIPSDRGVENLTQDNYDPNSPPETPSPPYGLSAAPGDTYITIGWKCDSREVFFDIKDDNGIVYQMGDINAFTLYGLEPSTDYYFQVRSVSWYDSTITSQWVSIGARTTSLDTTPPSAVENFKATANVDSIELTWDGNTEADLKGYYIDFQEQGSGVWNSIANPGFPGMIEDYSCIKGMTSWTVFSPFINPLTTYKYRIHAVDRSRNESNSVESGWVTPGVI